MLDASPVTARAATRLAVSRVFISTTVGLLPKAQALCAALSGDPAVISSVSVPATDIGKGPHCGPADIAILGPRKIDGGARRHAAAVTFYVRRALPQVRGR